MDKKISGTSSARKDGRDRLSDETVDKVMLWSKLLNKAVSDIQHESKDIFKSKPWKDGKN